MIHGQYPPNTGCYENGRMPTDDRQSFWGSLTESGYRTHGIGKCHYNPDRHALRGFESREGQEELIKPPESDHYLRFLHGKGYDYICDPHGVRGEMYYVPQVSQIPAELHPTQWIGDRTIAFIEEQMKSDQPWGLFSSFIHPHPPFSPPNPWHKLYRAPLMPLPNVPQDVESLHTYINRHQNRYKYRDQGIDQNLLRCMKAYYYGAISFIDYQIGRVLETLEKTGQLDNTLIICTADHGEHLGDYNCFGKRSMHNSAANIPMLARLPKRFAAGQVCTTPTSLVDIAPTVLSAAKTDIKSHDLDGMDLAEIAAGYSEREFVYSQHSNGDKATYMIVSEKLKYFYSAPDNQEYLFDKVTDPLETRNRAGSPFCKKDKKYMKSALMEFLKKNGETVGIENDDWKPTPKMDISSDPDTGLLVQDSAWAKTTIPGYTDDK